MRKTKRNNIYDLTLLSLLTAAALIFSYVEAVLPPIFSALPGIKLGFPNILIIYILYRMGTVRAAAVSLIRIVLAGMLFGTFVSFLYSFVGAAFSLTVMAIMKKTELFSTVSVSIAGGVLHNFGQILVAMLLFQTAELGYYMAVLAVAGMISGIFIGICAALLIKRLKSVFQ